MKRILSILIPFTALACLCILPACKKYNEYPSHLATVSFPVVTLVGPADTTINRGAIWKDPGATWKDTVTGESGTLKAQTINTATDSAYLLIYTATNKNGFQTAVARGLGVTNYNGPISLSGGYNGNTISISQRSRALFLISNVDYTFPGAATIDTSVIVIKSDSTISVASLGTYITGTTGAPVPETFSNATILYQSPFYYTGTPPRLTAQPAIIFSYTVNILNVPPFTAPYSEDLQ